MRLHPALLLVLAAPALAQEPSRPEPIEQVLEPIRAEHGVPALGAAVVRGGRRVEVGVTGVRRAGHAEPVQRGDLWHLGSCTKSMTATLVARLVERGRLTLATTLAEVFPERAAAWEPAWRAVTLEQLLSHRAGAPSAMDADGLWGRLWADQGRVEDQRLLVLDVLGKRPLRFAPGEGFEYSNAGFTIAGAVCERLEGAPWEELIAREVFAPLGMTAVGFGPPGVAGAADQPRAHRRVGDAWVAIEPGVGADNPRAIGPAGTVHASLEDWARYAAAHLAGARRRDGLVAATTFEELHRPRPPGEEGYALGWGVGRREWAGPAKRVLTHNGSNTMWFCVCWIAPDRDLAVLVTTSCGGDDAAKATDAAAGALIRRALADRSYY